MEVARKGCKKNRNQKTNMKEGLSGRFTGEKVVRKEKTKWQNNKTNKKLKTTRTVYHSIEKRRWLNFPANGVKKRQCR